MMPEVSFPDWDVLQQLPGYQVVLRAILKSQIKQLIEQLSSFGGEEAYLLSANVSDGTLSHIGSKPGEVFLNTHEQVKAEFRRFCMKNHQTQKPEKTLNHDHTCEGTRSAKKRKLSDDEVEPKSNTRTEQRLPAVRCRDTIGNISETPSVILSVESEGSKELEPPLGPTESGESEDEDYELDDGTDDFSDVPSVKEEDRTRTTVIRNKHGDGQSGNTDKDRQVVFNENTGIVVKQEIENPENTDSADKDRQVVLSDNTGIVVKQEIENPEDTNSGLAGFPQDPRPTTSRAGVDPDLDMAVDDDYDEDFKSEEDSDSDWSESTAKTKTKKENTGSKGRVYRKQYDLAKSESKAARLCGVPRTKLMDKLAGLARFRQPTMDEEKDLVDYAILMAEIGYPLNRMQICFQVKKTLDLEGRKSTFSNNLPGRGWYNAFKARNPDFTEQPQNVYVYRYQKMIVTEAMRKNWFDGLWKYLEMKIPDHKSLIEDPRCVFNADECGFQICVNTNEVIATKGAKYVYPVPQDQAPQITVMACLNAAGDYMPPLIVYPDQCFPDDVLTGFEEAIYGHTQTGWMDEEHFTAFIHNFNDFVTEKNITKPVLLFVNGHSSHIALETIRYCHDNGIHLYCLLESKTKILQACDIGVFTQMKAIWKQKVIQWHKEHHGEVFTKKQFPRVFKSTWDSVCTAENSARGFKHAGLFPLFPQT